MHDDERVSYPTLIVKRTVDGHERASTFVDPGEILLDDFTGRRLEKQAPASTTATPGTEQAGSWGVTGPTAPGGL